MISGVEEARRAVREQIGYGADLIKIFADGTYPTMTIEEISVIVEEAHKAGRRVAAHAATTIGIRNAVTAGVDSIEHGFRVDRATLELMKQKGVWLVPTYQRRFEQAEAITDDEIRPRARASIAALQKMLQTARELGVKIVTGSDPGDEKHHGANAREIVAFTAIGFTNMEAIRAGTISGAELMGWQDRLGSLETGKLADIIAVRGNPLSDIKQVQNVSFVMKGGVVIKDDRKVGK